jgi:hypothetical protein
MPRRSRTNAVLSGLALISMVTLTGVPTGSAAAATPAAPEAGRSSYGPCFLQPLRWNSALDGPLPTCPSDGSWSPYRT